LTTLLADVLGATQCLWLRRFKDLAHAQRKIAAFIARYNGEWLGEHRSRRGSVT